MTPISIETAALLCDVATRTIRRRIETGEIIKLFEDDRGRTMVSFDDVMPFARLRLTDDEREIMEEADKGNIESIGLVGSMFFNLKRYRIAKKWLEMAAKQNNADAMQTLGRCYLADSPADEGAALMWIARAATMGHQIAKRQIAGLTGAVKA